MGTIESKGKRASGMRARLLAMTDESYELAWSSTMVDMATDKALRARMRYWANLMRADELSGLRGWDRFDRPIRTEHAYPFGNDVTVRQVGDPVPPTANDPLITRDPGSFRPSPGMPRHAWDGYIGMGIDPAL